MDTVETAKYTITGLVDTRDEQNNITGQFAIGSVQELPVEFGDKEVAEGRAERFIDTEGDETEAGDVESATGEDNDEDDLSDDATEDEEVNEGGEEDESEEDEVE